MSGTKYDVLFTGKLVEGHKEEQVKANVAKLFKTDVAKVERLFVGMSVVIKKDVNKDTALKYMMAMQKAGAICETKEHSAASAVPSFPKAPAQTTVPSSAVQSANRSEAEIAAGEDGEMRFVIKEAPQGLGELADANVDEPGITLVEHQEVAPPKIDTSSLSVDKSDADLIEHEKVAPVSVDLSGLTLDEPGSRIGEEEKVPELDVDLSALTLDEPGVTLVEPEKPKKPDIDTSGLKLSGD